MSGSVFGVKEEVLDSGMGDWKRTLSLTILRSWGVVSGAGFELNRIGSLTIRDWGGEGSGLVARYEGSSSERCLRRLTGGMVGAVE